MQEEVLPKSTLNMRAITTHDPIGPILNISPWNFPFWLPIKAIIPPLVMGNPILLKHAPTTPLSANALEELFIDAGFNNGEFQNVYLSND